jgi:hypothetical protein
MQHINAASQHYKGAMPPAAYFFALWTAVALWSYASRAICLNLLDESFQRREL